LKSGNEKEIGEWKEEDAAGDRENVEFLKQDISSLERINGMLERDLLRLRPERGQSRAAIADQAAEWVE